MAPDPVSLPAFLLSGKQLLPLEGGVQRSEMSTSHPETEGWCTAVSSVIPLIGTVSLEFPWSKISENQTHMFRGFSFKYVILVEDRCVPSNFLFTYVFNTFSE